MAGKWGAHRFIVLSWYSQANRNKMLLAGAGAVFALAAVDRALGSRFELGFLYLFPILLMAGWLSRLQMAGLAVLCAGLTEAAGPLRFDAATVPRVAVVCLAFVGTGWFASELLRKRQSMIEHVSLLEKEGRLRLEAEEQLRAVIDSSPAAVITIDEKGKILLANEAAHLLLGLDAGNLRGRPVKSYLPVFADILRAGRTVRNFRSVMEFRGRRANGDVFLAHAWFSTYATPSGPRLAAIVLDASEHLRDREGLGLHSVMTASRILVGAVSHEVRNLCAAAAIAHANLVAVPRLAENEDFKALGTLIAGLKEIASAELRLVSDKPPDSADLNTVLDEFRILIEPLFSESEMEICWNVPVELPHVQGDHHGLLQVLLNLAQNSQRSMQQVAERRLTIHAAVQENAVLIRFRDTGTGVPVPDRLFQPFQAGAEATGLGLYVSRALVRSFSGDLRYEPQPVGSCFVVELAAATGRAVAGI